MAIKKTLVMGASTKAGRYSLLAAEMLDDFGHPTVLLGKKAGNIRGKEIKNSVGEIEKDIDTVTMYLSEENQKEYENFILDLKPKRVIFNPGAENFEFEEKLEKAGIEAIEACTLVMLSTRQY